MKKRILIYMLIITMIFCSACSGENSWQKTSGNTSTTDFSAYCDDDAEINVDLSQLSTTMVYATVYDMMSNYTNYVGKTVKITGEYFVYIDTSTGQSYSLVLVTDATNCCEQGVEFTLDDSYQYPGDYPVPGATITVVGTFNTYLESGYTYCELQDAYLVE